MAWEWITPDTRWVNTMQGVLGVEREGLRNHCWLESSCCLKDLVRKDFQAENANTNWNDVAWEWITPDKKGKCCGGCAEDEGCSAEEPMLVGNSAVASKTR